MVIKTRVPRKKIFMEYTTRLLNMFARDWMKRNSHKISDIKELMKVLWKGFNTVVNLILEDDYVSRSFRPKILSFISRKYYFFFKDC